MALGPRLDLRQSQSLVMTPQLQQAIKLLALSNLELEAYLAEALEGNPLLDTSSADSDGGSGDEPGQRRAACGRGGHRLTPTRRCRRTAEPKTTSTSTLLPTASTTIARATISGCRERGEDIDFDSFAEHDGTLHDHLLAQVGERFGGIEAIVAGATCRADRRGRISPRRPCRAGNAARRAAGVARGGAGGHPVLRSVGVGGRDLAECIAIQAREADRYDPAMATMIAHLDLVAKGAFPQLKRICGVDDEDLADMIRELRGYDPKPGLKFGGEERRRSFPTSISVRPRRAGWSRSTAAPCRGCSSTAAITPNWRPARRQRARRGCPSSSPGPTGWSRALDQRQRTIVKVASAIVKQQEAFSCMASPRMRPLTLRQVAEEIGMHRSTVSRVTSNKYLGCPRGLFRAQIFLLEQGISATEGDGAVSAGAVKPRSRR